MVIYAEYNSILLPLIQRNIELNGLEKNVSVLELNWYVYFFSINKNPIIPIYRGESVHKSIGNPDMILAADCVYCEPAFPLLVHTLVELTSSPSTDILFCYKKRRKVKLYSSADRQVDGQ